MGHNWKKNGSGEFDKSGISASEPPEILFIDQCCQLLKEGGKMAIVLPDGILGNPNTEYVRSWILKNFLVLASIDLAVEAFLPQVGVQASILFLQKKSSEEKLTSKKYEIFMGIAEKLGKDRRGNPIYQKDQDGAEILFDIQKQYLITDKHGKKELRSRVEKVRVLNDDLPSIVKEYKQFVTSVIN